MTKYIHKFIKSCLAFAFVAFAFTILISSITTFAQGTAPAKPTTTSGNEGLAGLQLSGIKCIFYQPGLNNDKYFPGCNEKTSLFPIILKFLQDIAPFITTILIIVGGYEYFVDEQAKKTSAKSTIFSALSGYVIIILAPTIANVVKETFNGGEGQPIKTDALFKLFNQIIDALLSLSTIVAVVVIVLAGYAYFLQFFVNGGKEEGKLNGRELLIAGIMGLIVTTLAKPIVGFVKSTLNSSGGDVTLKSDNIIALVRNILANFLIPLASIVTLVFIVASAYLWLTAGDSEDRVKNAKKTLSGALIGLVIVLLSTTIVQLIVYFIQPSSSFIPGDANSTTILKGSDPLKSPSTVPPTTDNTPKVINN